MTYENGNGGRVAREGSIGGSDASTPGFATFADVEERLVEAMRLWGRSPGEGRWPYASDAPWHLLTRTVRAAAGEVKGMDLQRLLQADDDEETRHWHGRERRGPLSRDEVARRDQASAWIVLVQERDRRMVILALGLLAGGRKLVPWIELWKALGRGQPGPDGLRMRYDRALHTICRQLNSRFSVSRGCQDAGEAIR